MGAGAGTAGAAEPKRLPAAGRAGRVPAGAGRGEAGRPCGAEPVCPCCRAPYGGREALRSPCCCAARSGRSLLAGRGVLINVLRIAARVLRSAYCVRIIFSSTPPRPIFVSCTKFFLTSFSGTAGFSSVFSSTFAAGSGTGFGSSCGFFEGSGLCASGAGSGFGSARFSVCDGFTGASFFAAGFSPASVPRVFPFATVLRERPSSPQVFPLQPQVFPLQPPVFPLQPPAFQRVPAPPVPSVPVYAPLRQTAPPAPHRLFPFRTLQLRQTQPVQPLPAHAGGRRFPDRTVCAGSPQDLAHFFLCTLHALHQFSDPFCPQNGIDVFDIRVIFLCFCHLD